MRTVLGLAAALFAVPGLAQQDPAGLMLRTKLSNGFEVVHDRVEPPGAGIVVAGLIGAAVQTGMQASSDETMRKQVAPLLSDSSCEAGVKSAMAATLEQNGRAIVDGAPSSAVPQVSISIHECSLRLVDSVAKQLAAYVSLTLEYKSPTETWIEKIQVTGRNQHPFDHFMSQVDLAQSELSDTSKRAGNRAANKIIYRR